MDLGLVILEATSFLILYTRFIGESYGQEPLL